MTPSRLSAVLIASTMIVSGCMETMPRPRPEKPVACTQEYAPVCAAKGRQRKTFSNMCMARAEGWRVVSNNACQSIQPR